jgi:glycosyltransferase involved in cell wall biosynthesis
VGDRSSGGLARFGDRRIGRSVSDSDRGRKAAMLSSRTDVRHKRLRVKETLIDQLVRSELYFARLRRRRPRSIIRTSPKLAYIGHSYHEKTRSSAFFLEYLKQYFDVEVIVDRAWSGIPLPDLSFIDKSYFGVVFFQTQPTRNLLDQIRNENVVFVPMYDSIADLGYGYWRELRGLKVINFSRTLHNRLLTWGFESMYIQYFPEPSEFTGGSADEVFFWRRISKIDLAVVAALFQGKDVRLHIHRAMDPRQSSVAISRDDEVRFGITYTDWFETREEMLDVVRQKGVFIAPRVREGIGMSFLEAMSMGKAVVAVDNPTMNEYIEHMKTGYLFDLERPKSLDFSGVRQVQRNAYQRVSEGYRAWESGKHRIIEFIRAE